MTPIQRWIYGLQMTANRDATIPRETFNLSEDVSVFSLKQIHRFIPQMIFSYFWPNLFITLVVCIIILANYLGTTTCSIPI